MTVSNLTTKRILIVEDEPAIGQVCHRILTSDGFEVDIVTNGVAAQQVIEEKPYDVCLLDIRMPDMDGKELFHWLEEKQPQMAKRIIFTTGDVIGRDTQTFLEQTGRPFLPKPFTPDELKNAVKETLQRSIP